jgi:hypothetical protein
LWATKYALVRNFYASESTLHPKNISYIQYAEFLPGIIDVTIVTKGSSKATSNVNTVYQVNYKTTSPMEATTLEAALTNTVEITSVEAIKIPAVNGTGGSGQSGNSGSPGNRGGSGPSNALVIRPSTELKKAYAPSAQYDGYVTIPLANKLIKATDFDKITTPARQALNAFEGGKFFGPLRLEIRSRKRDQTYEGMNQYFSSKTPLQVENDITDIMDVLEARTGISPLETVLAPGYARMAIQVTKPSQIRQIYQLLSFEQVGGIDIYSYRQMGSTPSSRPSIGVVGTPRTLDFGSISREQAGLNSEKFEPLAKNAIQSIIQSPGNFSRYEMTLELDPNMRFQGPSNNGILGQTDALLEVSQTLDQAGVFTNIRHLDESPFITVKIYSAEDLIKVVEVSTNPYVRKVSHGTLVPVGR